MSQPLFSASNRVIAQNNQMPVKSQQNDAAVKRQSIVESLSGSAAGNYRIAWAADSELRDICRLRYSVYASEYGWEQTDAGIDRNIYDDDADHLIVRETVSGRIAGGYRLRSSNRTREFSAQDEFDLSEILTSGRVCVELSRAFILPEYRQGTVLSLLWKGICLYLMENKADLLFGLSSIKVSDYGKVLSLIKFFYKSKRIWPDQNIRPHAGYDCSARVIQHLDHPDGYKPCNKRELPPLVRGYLNAGAFFCPVPAWDQGFNCIDFLTIMETAEMNKKFREKFEEREGCI